MAGAEPSLGMETSQMCEMDPIIPEKMKKLRFRQKAAGAAIIVKISLQDQKIILDDELEDCSVDELQEELPERQPRYVMYSYEYKHNDGRVSYPLCFIYYCPEGCNPNSTMLYAGSRNQVLNASGVGKLSSTDESGLSRNQFGEVSTLPPGHSQTTTSSGTYLQQTGHRSVVRSARKRNYH